MRQVARGISSGTRGGRWSRYISFVHFASESTTAVAAPAPADPQLGPYLIARGARAAPGVQHCHCAGGKTINQTPRRVAKSVLAVLGAFTQRARRQGY